VHCITGCIDPVTQQLSSFDKSPCVAMRCSVLHSVLQCVALLDVSTLSRSTHLPLTSLSLSRTLFRSRARTRACARAISPARFLDLLLSKYKAKNHWIDTVTQHLFLLLTNLSLFHSCSLFCSLSLARSLACSLFLSLFLSFSLSRCRSQNTKCTITECLDPFTQQLHLLFICRRSQKSAHSSNYYSTDSTGRSHST